MERELPPGMSCVTRWVVVHKAVKNVTAAYLLDREKHGHVLCVSRDDARRAKQGTITPEDFRIVKVLIICVEKEP